MRRKQETVALDILRATLRSNGLANHAQAISQALVATRNGNVRHLSNVIETAKKALSEATTK